MPIKLTIPTKSNARQNDPTASSSGIRIVKKQEPIEAVVGYDLNSGEGVIINTKFLEAIKRRRQHEQKQDADEQTAHQQEVYDKRVGTLSQASQQQSEVDGATEEKKVSTEQKPSDQSDVELSIYPFSATSDESELETIKQHIFYSAACASNWMPFWMPNILSCFNQIFLGVKFSSFETFDKNKRNDMLKHNVSKHSCAELSEHPNDADPALDLKSELNGINNAENKTDLVLKLTSCIGKLETKVDQEQRSWWCFLCFWQRPSYNRRALRRMKSTQRELKLENISLSREPKESSSLDNVGPTT